MRVGGRSAAAGERKGDTKCSAVERREAVELKVALEDDPVSDVSSRARYRITAELFVLKSSPSFVLSPVTGSAGYLPILAVSDWR